MFIFYVLFCSLHQHSRAPPLLTCTYSTTPTWRTGAFPHHPLIHNIVRNGTDDVVHEWNYFIIFFILLSLSLFSHIHVQCQQHNETHITTRTPHHQLDQCVWSWDVVNESATSMHTPSSTTPAHWNQKKWDNHCHTHIITGTYLIQLWHVICKCICTQPSYPLIHLYGKSTTAVRILFVPSANSSDRFVPIFCPSVSLPFFIIFSWFLFMSVPRHVIESHSVEKIWKNTLCGSNIAIVEIMFYFRLLR